jgi:hypothetical protein
MNIGNRLRLGETASPHGSTRSAHRTRNAVSADSGDDPLAETLRRMQAGDLSVHIAATPIDPGAAPASAKLLPHQLLAERLACA